MNRRLVLLLPALVAAGCRSSTDDAGRTALEVGIVPVIDVAPLYLGIEQGFFTAEGLDVTPRPGQSGATIVAGVVSGQQKIGFSNNTSLLIAASKKAPVRIVAAGNQAAAGDYAVIFAPAGGPIRTAKDLAGKSIAVNNLNNVGSLSINAALQASGVDITTVKFVEIPFPQMQAALAQKRVDAAWAVEPFASAIKAAGGVTAVLRPYPMIAPHFPVASYFTSTAFAGSDPDVVASFRTAMNRSLTYAQDHPDDARRILPTYIEIGPEVAARVVLPEWSPDVGAALLTRTAELARDYGYLTTPPDVTALVGG
ncbi:ABC transporter substrate-binding protein [Symbioplanes lichenis]|uniref:ABC transporter substrate-binding protein n=1 Tax=Symbioplanes lichenis TaxID=1629072 RepID=UPI00273821A5|nr:ABC transporter substrate-binding protein [Actinoplanes lichenis]